MVLRRGLEQIRDQPVAKIQGGRKHVFFMDQPVAKSRGVASTCFSCGERNFPTESECPEIAGATCAGHQRVDLVERNPAVVPRRGLEQI